MTADNNAARDRELLAALRDGDPSLLMKLPAAAPAEPLQTCDERAHEGMLTLQSKKLVQPPAARDKEALIDDVLRFDPLDTAEKLFGRDHPDAPLIGFLLLQGHTKKAQELMQETRDTFMSLPYAATCIIVAELGFERVYVEQFQADHGAVEEFAIWWHPGDGMLAVTESYNAEGTNKVHVHYQWKPAPECDNVYRVTQSGSFVVPPGVDRFTCPRDQLLWLGDYDGRTALRRHLTKLRENGSFVTPWLEQPHLWFVNYAETRQISSSGQPYKMQSAQFTAVTERKFQQLPAHVQAAMGPARS